VARCFYALQQSRADGKRYPAINPIESYSKYLEYPEFEEYIGKRIGDKWIASINELKTLLLRGQEVSEQINILGDDGVPVEYHIRFWKSEVIDFVILQQDAFDKVDMNTPLERQEYMLNKVMGICHTDFQFESFTEVGSYFKRVINNLRQMNYSEFETDEFKKFEEELNQIINERKVA
jgi:V/A-type H+-transporting ATPase subunit A